MVQFKKDLNYDGQKYTVKIPFMPSIEMVPPNLAVSKRVLNNVLSGLKQKNAMEAYYKYFETQLNSGILEEVPREIPTAELKFIPYFPVYPKSIDQNQLSKID